MSDRIELSTGLQPMKDLLVVIADSRHVAYAKQVFESAHRFGGWRGAYMLMTYRVPKEYTAWFERRGVIVRPYELPLPRHVYDLVQERYRVPEVVSLKYHLFGDDFKKWRTVICLDTDVIVSGSLDYLTRVKRFAAVPEFLGNLGNQFAADPPTQRMVASFAKTRSPAFNFGVFALRPVALGTNIQQRLCDGSIQWFPHARYFEQSVANMVFYRDWEHLPFRLNLKAVFGGVGGRLGTSVPFASASYLRKGLIFHFYGPHKPWDVAHVFHKKWQANLASAESVDSFSILAGDPSRFTDGVRFLCTQFSIWTVRFILLVRYRIGRAYRTLRGVTL